MQEEIKKGHTATEKQPEKKKVNLDIRPYLAIGLTDVELKDHMKFSIPIYWGISIVMLVIGVILGIVPLGA